MSEGFWKKIGKSVLGKDAMTVVDRMGEERKARDVARAKHILQEAGELPETQDGQPMTDVERAAYSAMKKLDAAKRDGTSMQKAELIQAARAIHKGRQSALSDLDPKIRQDLEDLAKNVFGIKDK